jgi:hypothetical protein
LFHLDEPSGAIRLDNLLFTLAVKPPWLIRSFLRTVAAFPVATACSISFKCGLIRW